MPLKKGGIALKFCMVYLQNLIYSLDAFIQSILHGEKTVNTDLYPSVHKGIRASKRCLRKEGKMNRVRLGEEDELGLQELFIDEKHTVSLLCCAELI